MVKITIRNSKAVSKNIKNTINGFLTDTRSMKSVNKILETEIKNELEDTQTQVNRIKPSTATRRGELSRVNKTSKYYAKFKSNLHFTGKLVASIRSAFAGSGKFELSFKGNHPRYKGLNGKPIGKVQSNEEIAGQLQKRGWILLFVPTKKAPKRILGILRRYIRRNKNI